MAVLSVKEKTDRRRSSYKDGKVTHVRVFQVKLDDPRDGTAVALTANDGTNRIPSPGDNYRGTSVSSIEADPVPNSAVHFEVTVESTDGDIEQFETHPLSRPAQISWSGSETTEPYFMDEGDDQEESKPVVNTALDPLEQFLERERGEMVITITRNEDYHDAAEADEYSHTTNLDYVTIGTTTFAPKTLKLSPIQAATATESWQGLTVEFYQKTYTLKARRQGWDDKPLDLGFNELFEATVTGQNGQPQIVKRKRPIVDANGLPVKKPVPLDGAGKALVLLPSMLPTETVVPLRFRPYRKVSWAPINLLVVA